MKQIFESEKISFVHVSECLVNDYLTMVNDYEHVNRFIGGKKKSFTVEQELQWVHEKLEEKVSILHEYHYKNVKKEDIPAYTRQMGIGLIIIGAGIIITGVLNLMYSSLWWIPLLTGFVLGLIVIYMAQKKYNGSVMG